MNELPPLPSDEEWVALGELFDQPGGPSRDAIFGLLHAVAAAPSTIPPSGWLPRALGDRDFGGDPTAMMLLRHYNTVLDLLAAGHPLVPVPTDEEVIRDWCAGYLLGVDLDPLWSAEEEAIALVFPIGVLAGDTPLNAPGDTHAVEDEEAWFREARLNLSDIVFGIYRELAPMRRAYAGRLPIQQPIRRTPKVGRNAACPCGSGKKYKKCCLRAAN